MTKIWTVSSTRQGEAIETHVFLTADEAWRHVALQTGGREDADVLLLRHWHAEHGMLLLDSEGNLTDPVADWDLSARMIVVQEHYLP
jgi:nuclear transport factor 2 (NTF2) superfamily protein